MRHHVACHLYFRTAVLHSTHETAASQWIFRAPARGVGKAKSYQSNAIDRRDSSLASATSALLSREGNPTVLYAALLDAAGIDNELVWVRGVSPDAEPDPDPAFVGVDRWMQMMSLAVRPSDGPEVWCDLSSKTMPYGKLVNNAERSPAFRTRSHRWVEFPALELAQRPGTQLAVTLRFGASHAADVEVAMEFTGNQGFEFKQGFSELPTAELKQWIQSLASSNLPGMTMNSFVTRGLDDDEVPFGITLKGVHLSYLDAQNGQLVCRFPFRPSELADAVSGEGMRTQAMFMPRSTVDCTRVRIELPKDLSLAQLPQEMSEEFHGAHYRLAIEDLDETGFTIIREFRSPPMLLKPEEYQTFVAFAKRVDEVERGRLRFVRAEAPSRE